MKLRHYQEAGRHWLIGNRTRFLADDPGLGKTVQSLFAAFDEFPSGADILVVAPAIGRVSWAIEVPKCFNAWLAKARADWDAPRAVKFPKDRPTGPIGVCVIDGKPVPKLKALMKLPRKGPREGFSPFNVIVVSYDTLVMNDETRKLLMDARPWPVVILDEAHYLKSATAKRTKLCYGKDFGGLVDETALVFDAGRVYPLSGTPTPNHAGELWTHLHALAPNCLPVSSKDPKRRMDRVEFEDTFCRVNIGVYGRQVVGSKNQEQLRALVKPFLMRRRIGDVLTEMPDLQTFDVPLDMPTSAQQQAVAAAVGFALHSGQLPDSDDDALLALLKGKATHIATARRALGLAKSIGAVQWIKERVANGTKKLIVFAHHLDVLDYIHENLGLPLVRVDGATDNRERVANVDRFQNEPDVSIFLGQIQAAGTAITLTAAHEVAMVEVDWVPANNDQAIGRARRIGQKSGVLAHFLHVPGTLDETIMRAYRRKAQETAQLYDAAAPKTLSPAEGLAVTIAQKEIDATAAAFAKAASVWDTAATRQALLADQQATEARAIAALDDYARRIADAEKQSVLGIMTNRQQFELDMMNRQREIAEQRQREALRQNVYAPRILPTKIFYRD